MDRIGPSPFDTIKEKEETMSPRSPQKVGDKVEELEFDADAPLEGDEEKNTEPTDEDGTNEDATHDDEEPS